MAVLHLGELVCIQVEKASKNEWDRKAGVPPGFNLRTEYSLHEREQAVYPILPEAASRNKSK